MPGSAAAGERLTLCRLARATPAEDALLVARGALRLVSQRAARVRAKARHVLLTVLADAGGWAPGSRVVGAARASVRRRALAGRRPAGGSKHAARARQSGAQHAAAARPTQGAHTAVLRALMRE